MGGGFGGFPLNSFLFAPLLPGKLFAFHPIRPFRDPRLAGGEEFGVAGWDLQPPGSLSYLELPGAPFGSGPPAWLWPRGGSPRWSSSIRSR